MTHNNHQLLRQIEALERRLVEMEGRLAKLEGDHYDQFKQWPFSPGTWPLPTHELDPGCHVCGIKAKDATHYCCQNPQCPGRVTYGTVGDPTPPSWIGDDLRIRSTCVGTDIGATTTSTLCDL